MTRDLPGEEERRKNKHTKSLNKAKRYLETLKIKETFSFKIITGKIAGRGIDVRGAVVDLVEEGIIERIGTINFPGGGTSVLYRRVK